MRAANILKKNLFITNPYPPQSSSEKYAIIINQIRSGVKDLENDHKEFYFMDISLIMTMRNFLSRAILQK